MDVNNHMNYIDYSQLRLFKECPLKWYERYVKGLSPKHEGQRDDPLAVGSAFHNGMENWYRERKPYISDNVLEELQLTKEAYDDVMMMLVGYARQYPNDAWETKQIEEPVCRPLVNTNDYSLVAKIDQEFELSEITEISSGWGETLTLEPGVWTSEFKTKTPTTDIIEYQKSYRFNMQPSFQLLALQYKHGIHAAGVLMNVVEKPKRYVPQRKCKQCSKLSNYSDWMVVENDLFSCPKCQNKQKLASVKETVTVTSPKYYRFPVYRSQQRLDLDLMIIEKVAEEMKAIRTGLTFASPNWESCLNNISRRPCEFILAHENIRTAEKEDFEYTDNPLKYIFG